MPVPYNGTENSPFRFFGFLILQKNKHTFCVETDTCAQNVIF